MKKKSNEKSRTEIIIDEILCGGFTEDELQEIIDTCNDEIDRIQNEEE